MNSASKIALSYFLEGLAIVWLSLLAYSLFYLTPISIDSILIGHTIFAAWLYGVCKAIYVDVSPLVIQLMEKKNAGKATEDDLS